MRDFFWNKYWSREFLSMTHIVVECARECQKKGVGNRFTLLPDFVLLKERKNAIEAWKKQQRLKEANKK